MSFLTPLRRLILGRRVFILSHLTFKRIVLTGQMAIVVFIVAFSYLVFDLLAGVYIAWPYQGSCAALALVSFFLNRAGKHTIAKVVLVVVANLTVYVFAASETISTELNVFFVVIAIATIAGFGYEQRYMSVGFVVLTLVLYASTIYFDFKPIQDLSYDPDYAFNNRIVNFVMGIISASSIVFALIAVNFHSEKALRESEQLMIKKNEELSTLNVELDRFVYSSSHDLQAPLRSILGLVTLSNLTEDQEEVKKYLAMIKDRVMELEKFIKEMSDYAKNASKSVAIEEFDIKKMIREILETLRFYPHAEKLSISINIEEGLMISSDHTRLKVILSNIISNCFKYCDLEKRDPFIRIDGEEHNSCLHLVITDNGMGISESALPKIFDMFYRAHEKGEGTGLGLYIVKETLNKLGGTIVVHSSVGNGTVFKITLPTRLIKQ
jgi:signal transduction histidine kinase